MRARRLATIFTGLALVAGGTLAVAGTGSAAPAAPAGAVTFQVPSAVAGIDANCTVQAFPPQGILKSNVTYGGNVQCDQVVDTLRFIVRANPKFPFEDGDNPIATDVVFRDFHDRDNAADDGSQSYRDWPEPTVTTRTIVQVWKMTADQSTIELAGTAISPYVTFG